MISTVNNIGYGLRFTADNARQVQIPHNPAYDFTQTDNFSFAAWLTVYAPNNTFGVMLFSKATQGGDRGYFFNASPAFAGISLRDGGGNFRRRVVVPGITLGVRFHIVCTKDGVDPANWRTYINGEDKPTAFINSGGLTSINNTVAARINSYEGLSGSAQFDMYDLQAYGKALTPDEAGRVYRSLGAVPPSLQNVLRGHWSFDHRRGVSLSDYSTYGNTGTLLYFPAAATAPGASNSWLTEAGQPFLT